MAKKIILNAVERSGKTEELRAENFVPAVVYGHSFENKNVAVKYSDLEKTYLEAGESALLDLMLGEENYKVIIYDIQRHPLTGRFMHVDFYKVKMDEKIETEVTLEFVGEAPAVRELGGSLVKAMDHLQIECLPGDLIQTLTVDLSVLKTMDDVIRVSDLKVPESITILSAPDSAIVLVEEIKEETIQEKTPETTTPAAKGEASAEAAAEGAAGAKTE